MIHIHSGAYLLFGKLGLNCFIAKKIGPEYLNLKNHECIMSDL